MSTTVFLKQPAHSLAAYAGYSYANAVRSVLASANAVTNSGSGTAQKVLCTLTAGGAAAKFISPPFAADTTISGTITMNFRGLESNLAANVGPAFQIIRDSDGAVILDSAKGTEFTASDAAYNWTGTPTSMVVGKGDRIRIVPYGASVGTMASGNTFTMSYGGRTSGAAGDTFVTFTETFSFQAEPEYIQGTLNAAGSVTLAGASAVGNVLLVGCKSPSIASSTFNSISDTQTNTWFSVVAQTAVSDGGSYVIQGAVVTKSGTLTLTDHVTGLAPDYMNVHEFAGIATTGTVDVASPIASGTTTNTFSATENTTAPCTLLVGFGDCDGTQNASGTGFTPRPNAVAANWLLEDQAVLAAGNYKASFVFTGESHWLGAMVALKAASQIYAVTDSDAVSVADSDAGAVDRTSSASDSVTVGDTAAGGVDRTSTLSDSVTASDAASGALDFTLSASAALTLADAPAAGIDRTSTAADAVSVADANAGNLDHTSILSDAATLADAAAGGFDITVSTSDSLSLTAAASGSLDVGGSAGDSTSMGDAGGANMDAGGAGTDAVTVAATAASQADFLSSLADALTPSDAAAGEVTGGGTGDPVSIRERIERLVRARVATIYGVGRAFRWDMRGVIDPATGLAVDGAGNALLQRVGDALVLGLDENELEGEGGIGMTVLELMLQVQVKIGQDADETVTTSELLNRWLLAIERAVMANPEMWDGGADGAGVRLAVDAAVSHTRQGSSMAGQAGGGEAIAAVNFVVQYQHYRNDPYSGPGIVEITLPAIDEFAAAGTPDPEDDTLSIKERIEQLIQTTIAGLDGIGRVFRWDMRGLRDPETGLAVDGGGNEIFARGGDALVLSLDETAAEGAMGSTGMTIKKLALRVEAKTSQDADLQQTTEAAHTSWLAKFEEQLLGNPRLADADGALLAVDLRVTQTHEPPRDAGQIEAISAIDFEIQYEHYRNDPAAGPGVTHLIEA